MHDELKYVTAFSFAPLTDRCVGASRMARRKPEHSAETNWLALLKVPEEAWRAMVSLRRHASLIRGVTSHHVQASRFRHIQASNRQPEGPLGVV
jgi:hypothetical protein